MKLRLTLLAAAAISGIAALPPSVAAPATATIASSASFDPAAQRAELAKRILAAASASTLDAARTAALDLDLARYRFLSETDGGRDAAEPAARGKRRKDRTVEAKKNEGLAPVLADAQGAAFLGRLYDDRAALDDYLDTTFFTAAPANRADGLLAWSRIDKAYPESRDGVWRRASAALAAVFGEKRFNKETAWGRTVSRELDPVERYEFFRASSEKGLLVPYFATAPAWELAFVVHGNYLPVTDLLWAQQMTPEDRLAQRSVASMAYAPVRYRLYNYRDDSVQHFGTYYDGKAGGLSRMADYGAVCGGISHTGAAVAVAHGVPAFTIGQPGHCAYVYKGSPSSWDGGNFVSGWRDSNGAHQLGFWASAKSVDVRLLTRAYTHPHFRDALRLVRLAEVRSDAGDDKGAIAALDRAIALCPMLYPAHVERLAALRRTNAAPTVLAKACIDAARDLAEFPAAGDAVRDGVEKELVATLPAETRPAYLAAIAGALASVPPQRQQGLDVESFTDTFSRQLAHYGLKEREVAAVIGYAVAPKKVKKGEEPPPAPTLKAPAKTDALVRYLNGLAPAANARASFAKAVEAVVAALPLDARKGLALKTNPPADEPAAKYDAKHFVRIGDWSASSVAAAPVITAGWKELEFTIPAALRKPGRIVVAAVHKGGEAATLENLRLFADGEEVDADTSSVAGKPRRPGLFVLDLDNAHARAGRLTLKVLVADDGKNDAAFAGEISLFDASPTAKR